MNLSYPRATNPTLGMFTDQTIDPKKAFFLTKTKKILDFFRKKLEKREPILSAKWILSATEIETFETCRRKWALLYLEAIKPPPSKAAELGIRVHGVLEKHLTGNSISYETTEGRIASAGLHFLPQALSQNNVEKPIFFLRDGMTFHGYIDFFEQVGSQTWVIGDHKTKSNLTRILSSDELKKDTQANIYAQWAFIEKEAERVKLRWIYYRTQSTPKSICIESELTREEAEHNFIRIAKVAHDIVEIAKEKPDSSSQPKNFSACFKYGRCHFYDQCKSRQQTAATSYQPHPPTTEMRKTAVHKVKELELSSSYTQNQNSFHLFVDCLPTKIEAPYERTLELSELLKPILIKIQTEKELSHYRLAGYGQHVGIIANYLREHLTKESYDAKTAILSSVKTPEGCDTLQTLTSQAGLVVRGF